MAAGDAASEFSSTPRGSNYASSPGPRIRSRVACQGCNRRKVRCDVAQTGPPCSNCQHDKAPCEVLPRKKHRPRRTRDSLPTEQSAVQYEGSLSHSRAGQSNRSIQHDENTLGAYNGTALFQEPPVAAVGPRPGSLENEAVGIEHSTNRPTASALEGDAILPDDSSFSYIGDKRGPRQSVYDLCHPGTPQEARPYLPVRAPNISHKPHEVEYMRHQGIFAALPDDVCDELIYCYFQHVHFFLPVIDAASFLNEYISNGSQSMNPLLFWSMLLAAANFAEAGVLQRAGFSSRKAMKSAMYERAKCLYDLDRGTDKLILIQSVLLLGFWYTDPQDHTGAWYWIGIAISLSQSIGLHRSPRSTSRTQQPSQARQSLMRRIWWTCLVRDRWVSLAKGRPMRIHSEDCDSPWPVAQDILDELECVSILAREKFIPVDSGNLAKMWIQLVSISDILGGILRLHYRANGPAPCIRDIDRYAEELQDCLQVDFCSDDMSDILRGQAYQLGLFHQAAVAILYRPYVLNESASLPSDAHPSWLRTATRRAREAASSTNSLLENLIEVNAIKFLKPMIITALIPAMQIHLFDCKSTNPLICGLGSNKLQLCMLVLSNLRETYWSAGVMYRLFEKAQMILGNSNPELPRAARGTASGNNRTTSQNKNQNYVNLPLDHRHGHQESEISMLLTPEPNLPLNEQPAPSWFNTSPRFSNVDQLLSPGFSLSENVFQDLFPDYDGGMVYDPIVPVSNGISEDMLYNI